MNQVGVIQISAISGAHRKNIKQHCLREARALLKRSAEKRAVAISLPVRNALWHAFSPYEGKD